MPVEAPGDSSLGAREEAELFRSIAVGSPDGVVAADGNGRIHWVNPAAAVIFCWSVHELVGRPLTVLVAPEQQPQVLELRRRAVVGAQLAPLTTTGRRRDETTFPLWLVPVVRRAPDGRLLGIGLVLRDLTDERRVQRDLTEALARAHARFDQVSQPQALLDLGGRFVAVNDAACRLLGKPRERLLGCDVRDLLPSVEAGHPLPALDRLAAGDDDTVGYEGGIPRPDGTRAPLLVELSLVRDRDGTPQEIVLVAHDLSGLAHGGGGPDQDAFVRALYRRASDPAFAIDEAGRLRYASPAFTRVFGPPPEDRVVDGALDLGPGIYDVLHPDDVEVVQALIGRLKQHRGSTERITVRARAVGGRWRWFEAVATDCLDDPSIGGIVVNLHDVTAEVSARETLRKSERRYRAIVETAQEGIVALDPRGVVLFANEKAADILGVDQLVLQGASLLDLLDPDERRRVEERLLGPRATGPERFEVRYTHPDGARRILSVSASPLTDDAGGEPGTLGMVSDVTLEREAEAELRHQALHDSLTGLPNRALLIDRLAMAAARQQREGGDELPGLAVLFLDLDHFKRVNDSRGHETGDRLLVEVAQRLSAAVRETDTVARLGGDEFAVICEDATASDAEAVADRIQESLRLPFVVGGEHVYVGASIGIAMSPPESVTDLLSSADAAMYAAKVGGRSRTSVHQGIDSLGSQRRRAITAALHEALDGGGVTLGYQPIVDFSAQRLVGLEALIRWQHPTLGLVPAEEVVTAAEAAGLSFELDRSVIRAAGRDLVGLRHRGVVGDEVFVAVNISPRTTAQQRLDELVREMLAETGLPASCLSLEITEHAIMDHADQAGLVLHRLAETGVRVAIDDFGTGYNSLTHLQRLPVRTLKIDQSFVSDLANQPDSLTIARSVVGLARALGMGTVAEGVEQHDQLSALRELGCDAGQGYLWGPATGVDELAGVLAGLAD